MLCLLGQILGYTTNIIFLSQIQLFMNVLKKKSLIFVYRNCYRIFMFKTIFLNFRWQNSVTYYNLYYKWKIAVTLFLGHSLCIEMLVCRLLFVLLFYIHDLKSRVKITTMTTTTYSNHLVVTSKVQFPLRFPFENVWVDFDAKGYTQLLSIHKYDLDKGIKR